MKTKEQEKKIESGVKEEECKGLSFRSDEVQEVLDRKAGWIVRWGITVLGILVLGVLASGFFIRYPGYVTVPMVLAADGSCTEVRTEAGCTLVYVRDKESFSVDPGDTIAIVATDGELRGDTCCLTASATGKVQMCDLFRKGEWIPAHTVLYVWTAENGRREHFGRAYVSEAVKQSLSAGMSVEIVAGTFPGTGRITRVASVPRPEDGLYAVELGMELPVALQHVAVGSRATARFKVSDRTVFEQLFQGCVKAVSPLPEMAL